MSADWIYCLTLYPVPSKIPIITKPETLHTSMEASSPQLDTMQSLSVHKQAARPSQGQRLPNELLLHVIRFLEPTGSEFLSAAPQTTKTLLALMRLCKTTDEAAGSIFSRHCIYLDSEDRTLRFARCLSLASSRPMPGHRPPFAGITSIFLESFLEYTNELEGTLALVEPNPCGPSDLTQEGHGSRVGEVEEENNDGAEEFAGDGADEEA